MIGRIAQALERMFQIHRIVFWYDEKREFRADFWSIQLPDVEKLELAGNEFGIKYRILKAEPGTKFLLYKDGPPPADPDNWLLDVQLAHAVFKTNQTANLLAELELGPEFSEIVEKHKEFYQSARRVKSLKSLVNPNDSMDGIRLKMLAVCAVCEPHPDALIETLIQELSNKKDDRIRLIVRCGLNTVLWDLMKRRYGYESKSPGMHDFVISLFKTGYAHGTERKITMTGDALVFLKRWKDSRRFEDAFEKLSDECALVLKIEDDLGSRDFRELMDLDYFQMIDQKIISDMVREVSNRTVSDDEVYSWVRTRRGTHWFSKHINMYQSVKHASRFMAMLTETKLGMETVSDAIRQYVNSWYRLDYHYRKFCFHVRKCGHATLTKDLSGQIEDLYSNSYLLKLNDKFKELVDKTGKWETQPFLLQQKFFTEHVRPFLDRDNKVCVIISDGMRFEIGHELLRYVLREDRYSADLEPLISMLPSYTQMGMAALLPNRELKIANNETGTVFVDGQSSKGIKNRIKILNSTGNFRAAGLKADEFMAMKGDACRELIRDHEVIYIYHNRIDDTGDKRDSEEKVFEAADETVHELVRIIKKLTAANANNLLVTADHGFIYQNRKIDESDFSSVDACGERILFRDRRFAIGMGMHRTTGLHTFSADQLGLAGDVEVQIPGSINRLRLKGSGSRYVHGGASLQEIVLPVIKINKKRKSDIRAVNVDILRGPSSIITSGQVAVVLYQTEPVTEKVQPRILRAGFFNDAGELISDTHKLTFDVAAENPRERETTISFMFTKKSDESNGREVFLRLEEKHAKTSYYNEYKSLRYLMRRSFTSDFDF